MILWIKRKYAVHITSKLNLSYPNVVTDSRCTDLATAQKYGFSAKAFIIIPSAPTSVACSTDYDTQSVMNYPTFSGTNLSPGIEHAVLLWRKDGGTITWQYNKPSAMDVARVWQLYRKPSDPEIPAGLLDNGFSQTECKDAAAGGGEAPPPNNPPKNRGLNPRDLERPTCSISIPALSTPSSAL